MKIMLLNYDYLNQENLNKNKELSAQRLKEQEKRRKSIENAKTIEKEQLKRKQELEDKHFKKYMELKEKIKQNRIKGIMDAEKDLVALDGILRQMNVWNAWDKVEVNSINKHELAKTELLINKGSLGKVFKKRAQTSHRDKRAKDDGDKEIKTQQLSFDEERGDEFRSPNSADHIENNEDNKINGESKDEENQKENT